MNTGLISSRYAKALLMLTQESGRGEQVCKQIYHLLADPDHVPDQLEPDIQKLVLLLEKNHRLEYLKFIFHSYIDLYYKSAGIVRAKLITAVPAPGLEDKICSLISGSTGCRIVLDTKTDPDIIGGFVLEIDDKLLDASVRRQLEIMHTRFVEKNTRLV